MMGLYEQACEKGEGPRCNARSLAQGSQLCRVLWPSPEWRRKSRPARCSRRRTPGEPHRSPNPQTLARLRDGHTPDARCSSTAPAFCMLLLLLCSSSLVGALRPCGGGPVPIAPTSALLRAAARLVTRRTTDDGPARLHDMISRVFPPRDGAVVSLCLCITELADPFGLISVSLAEPPWYA